MNIRVAYDVSVLSESFGRVDFKHGIARVYEELLFALSNRSDVELNLVNLCTSEDILQGSIKARAYVRTHSQSIRGRYVRSFKSRLRLTSLYDQVFSACYADELRGDVNNGTSSILDRRLRGVLYRMLYTYGIDKLKPAFDQRHYDVFHSPFLGLPSANITKTVPRVLTVYDLIPIRAPEFVGPHATQFLQGVLSTLDLPRDWVTCISAHTRTEFCEYTGMAPERVFVTPLAASAAFRRVDDADEISAVRQRYGVPDGDYFLTLAAPQPRKNLAHLIRCFFRLLDDYPALEANLVLAGSKEHGWLYDEIFEAAESSAKHHRRLIFTGFIADEDLAALYSGARAFVFPSLYEGFGLPPLEAMQCGTPVITSNTTALPEVVGNAGLMVDPTDADALCQAMLDVLRDGGLRQALKERGLARAAQFSWKRCAEQTVDAYQAAVSEGPQRPS